MLKVRRLPIDTWREPVVFLNRACRDYPPETLLGPGKVEVRCGERRLVATLNVVEDEALVGADELGLSAFAFEALGAAPGALAGIARAPEPESRPALRAKIAGGTLEPAEIDAVVDDIVAGRYAGREIAGFLIAASRALDDAEVIALARSRARHAPRLSWPAPVVVDKHSIGGIPGTRVTMIVVPIVAAHGLTIPKTSSRAITSAAGTADAMEVLARVDLDVAAVRRTVEATGGCIVWNGRLSQSPVDDVMNAVTRPLGIDSDRLAVASILSKKLAAGATHVVLDVPVGATAKVRTEAEAHEIARLFAVVAEGLGLAVAVEITDGSQPIGRGIGPALEARDVMKVLACAPDAPGDLRDKALMLAGRMIAFAAGLDEAAAAARARALLEGGEALKTMEAIIDAQGRNPAPPGPGPLTHEVAALRAGRVAAIDCYRIAGIARRAGAPLDKGAGLDLFKRVGDAAASGEPLYRIHASQPSDLETARRHAEAGSGIAIAED